MKSRRGLRVAFFLLLPVVARAAPLERDLGQGLLYFRIRELPADLPANRPGPAPACVVDLRYVQTGGEGAAAFAAWLEVRATVRSPVLVLANGETAAELRRSLREAPRGSGRIVIGIVGPDFTPDAAVPSTRVAERVAYDSLEQGTPLAMLLSDNPGKVRNDEARLNRSSASRPAPAATTAGQAPAPVVDFTLQRAVHLHRSLLALRRG